MKRKQQKPSQIIGWSTSETINSVLFLPSQISQAAPIRFKLEDYAAEAGREAAKGRPRPFVFPPSTDSDKLASIEVNSREDFLAICNQSLKTTKMPRDVKVGPCDKSFAAQQEL